MDRDVAAVVEGLKKLLPGRVHVDGSGNEDDEEIIDDHSHDASFHHRQRPHAVIFPEKTEEVAAAVKIIAKHKVPIVPRGGGTGLEGGSIPVKRGVVIAMERFKHFEVRKEDMLVICGPGWRKSGLNNKLKEYGLIFGPDPASDPCVGGMLSTGGSGMSTLKYGTSKENVASLTVVTASGDIVQTKPRVRKSSTGYDLTQLFSGSEGTLGIICELALRVFPLPTERMGAVAAFETVARACECVVRIRASALATLVRCELLNAEGVDATNRKFKTTLPIRPTLFFELQGFQKTYVASDLEEMKQLCQKFDCISFSSAEGDAIDKLWEARRGCWYAAHTFRPERKGIKVYPSDVCVPLKALPNVIQETEKDFNDHGFPCIMCCHIADGNFHCTVPYLPTEVDKLRMVEGRMIDRALAAGGTVSGEHGVGVGKMKAVAKEKGVAHLRILRAVKKALDPDNIMNPGKMFELNPESKL